MSDVNRVIIQGRVIKPISLRRCPDNKPVADFVIISNRKKLPKDDPERPKYATLVKVTLWSRDAEFWAGEQNMPALDAGDEVLVDGQLFGDDFTPKGSETKTTGRLRIDSANITLLRRGRRNQQTTADTTCAYIDKE